MADDPKILAKSVEDLNDRLNDVLDNITSIGSIIGKTAKNELVNFTESTRQIANNLLESKDLSKDIKKISEEIVKANIKNTKLSIDRKIAEEKLNLAIKAQATATNSLEKKLASAAQTKAKNQLISLTSQLQTQESIENELKVLLKIAEAENKKNDIIGEGKKKLEGHLAKYLSIFAILKFIIDAGLKADKQTTDLAKSLGIGKDQARGIRNEFVAYSRAAEDIFVTTEKLVEAQLSLSEQLGVSVKYSTKQAEDFARLTKLMGLSVEQAGKLARLSVVNGISIEATTKSIIKGSFASQMSNKISIDQREILKDVSNLSEGILIKFQGNSEALGAAVVQARKLGTTLAEIDKIGESFLNWESSIENELKAELITGKQLNFERARGAALIGDQATLMQEIASQVGTLADFQNMNIIAQKSLAEAFGLGRDEMSKMLLEQEKINKLGDVSQMTLEKQLEALRAQGEPIDSILYKQIQQQSAQEKFNNAVEKLQDLIGNLVAGPLGSFIDGMASLAKHSWAVYGAIGLLAGVSLVKTIGSLVTMATTLAASSIEALTLGSVLTAGIGIPIALAAAAAGYTWMTSTSDKAVSNAQNIHDGVAPSSKGPFTITDSFGATAITAKGDGIAVSPNINKGGNNDLSPMINAINEVREAIKNLEKRPSVAYINGKDAFARNLGTINALGTSQVQNSYKLA
jgi:hypothetical protein